MQGLNAEEERALILSVGTHRKERELSPIEVARLLQKAVNGGMSRNECARELQIGLSQVAAFLNLLRLAPEIQELGDWGDHSESMIPFSSLAQLAGLRDHADQVTAAHAILAYRLTWKEVVQLVQLRNRSRKAIAECVNDVLKLRPIVEKRHVFVGAIASEQVKNVIRSLLQRDRDELMRRSLRTVLQDTQGFTGRLGIERFTIVGDRDLAQTLGVSADVLESRINQTLVEEASRL